MDQVGTALIGCGKVGHTHARAFAALKILYFAAVCGRDPAKAGAFADRYGVRAYTDLEAMLQSPDLQVVSICTPQHTHLRSATACTHAGKTDVITHYHELQIQDFLQATVGGSWTSMSGRKGPQVRQDIYRHLSPPTGPKTSQVPTRCRRQV